MIIDFADRSPKDRYHLMTDVITPRPVAWVVTEGIIEGEKITNIAPFSYFTPISSAPPTVMISIGHRPDGRPKDTLRNLRANGKCTIAIVTPELLTPMHQSGQSLEAYESELERFGIPSRPVLEGYPPMPEGIRAVLFGTYLQEVDLQGSKTIPVIIRIDHLYLDEAIISDPETLTLSLDPIGRMGGTYRTLGEEVAP